MKTADRLFLALGVAAALAWPSAGASTLSLNRRDASSQDQQDKKKDKKKKKGDSQAGGEDSPDNVAGAKRAIKRGLSDFQDGFEGKSPRRVTDMLDDKFEDLPRFEEAITQFLERTSEMRINFRESTTEIKEDHATVIVDAEMIYTDKAKPTQDQRRKERVQFDFVYNPKKGWRIFEITPRQFFEP